jgi:NADH-quinone oxidoreductase subunit N
VPANVISGVDTIRFLPEIILTVLGTLFMVLDPLLRGRMRHLPGNLSLLGLAAAIAAAAYASLYPGDAFSHLLVVDGFSTFFRMLVLAVGLFSVLAAYRFLDRERAETGEYHALILFSLVGQCIMAGAADLIMVFIGIEISSIASYVLAGYLRDDKRANEAALKYFLLGSFATAFLLYGVALVYGLSGSTNLAQVRAMPAGHGGDAFLMLAAAAGLIFVGLAFKVSGAPFQIWAPDVYQGAPSPVSAFLSAGPKAAAFAVFLRVFLTAFAGLSDAWAPLIWISALLSMVIGNFGALTQTNVKRILGYSSIAHAGYVLVALAAQSNTGTAAAMFYLAAYACMNAGAFAVVAHLSGKGERFLKVDDFAGLAQKQPFTAAMLTIFLLSLTGVPLTGGFFGKFYIFQSALQSHLGWLVVLGLLNSAVGAFYYLRIVAAMYMRQPGESMDALEPLSVPLYAALFLPAAGTLILGIFPGVILGFANDSAHLLR